VSRFTSNQNQNDHRPILHKHNRRTVGEGGSRGPRTYLLTEDCCMSENWTVLVAGGGDDDDQVVEAIGQAADSKSTRWPWCPARTDTRNDTRRREISLAKLVLGRRHRPLVDIRGTNAMSRYCSFKTRSVGDLIIAHNWTLAGGHRIATTPRTAHARSLIPGRGNVVFQSPD